MAIDIVDGPSGARFEGDEREWTVVRCTCAQLEDYTSYRQIMDRVRSLLSSKEVAQAAVPLG